MNSQKLSHLLEQFGLTGRIARSGHDIPSIMGTPLQYAPVNELIQQERKRSLEYLKQNL